MPARCYWCVYGAGEVVVNSIGDIGEPIGMCKECHVLACGHHAVRDHVHKEYLCFDCDGSIARASASYLANLEGDQRFLVIGDDRLAVLLIEFNAFRLFRSAEDLFYRRPEYRIFYQQILRVISYADDANRDLPVGLRIWFELPEDAKVLLTAAAMLTQFAFREPNVNPGQPFMETYLISIIRNVQ